MQKATLVLISAVLLLPLVVFAQLSAPKIENVYGGRINAITGYSLSADSTRIFISTESANSVFYTDVHRNAASEWIFEKFTVIPGLDAVAGYGPWIQKMAVHPESQTLYFAPFTGLHKFHSGRMGIEFSIIMPGNINAFLVVDSRLFVLTGNNLHFGSLDGSGNLLSGTGSPLILPSAEPFTHLQVHPLDSTLYVFANGNVLQMLRSSDEVSSISAATTFANITPGSLNPSVDWLAFGIAPDGRAFLGGTDWAQKFIAYSDNDTSWVEYDTGLGGVAGGNFAFSGDSASYSVFFSSAYNSKKGESGHWQRFGLPAQAGEPGGFETHPNDGAVFVDPSFGNIVYMTTDQGIGASTDSGASIFEINDGVEAVQISDFDMTSSKNTAWLASKAGIRKVTNYRTSPLWTHAIFPNNDGSPYYSCEMIPDDTNTVYVGNARVYKTTNSGDAWTQVFSLEAPPYNLFMPGPRVEAIEVCDYDHDVVFAGYHDQTLGHGGLFYTKDAGANWQQILIEASTIGQDVDVSDVVFSLEGSDTVAYVGVEYDLNNPKGRSIYKLTKNGDNWTVAQDMGPATTSTGTAITATIRDLQVSVTSDTIYAAGADAGANHPVAYFKPLNGSGLWTPLPTDGFPFESYKQASAITVGIDTVYCAVDNEIYYLPVGDSEWKLGYTYPVGIRINVLYFDDLLVGTETGLYGHSGLGDPTPVENSRDETPASPTDFVLHQNYPNPFNPSTVIRYQLAQDSRVTIKVFDILGREVATLVNEFRPAGSYRITFDASHLSNGIYFYQIMTDHFKAARKMILAK